MKSARKAPYSEVAINIVPMLKPSGRCPTSRRLSILWGSGRVWGIRWRFESVSSMYIFHDFHHIYLAWEKIEKDHRISCSSRCLLRTSAQVLNVQLLIKGAMPLIYRFSVVIREISDRFTTNLVWAFSRQETGSRSLLREFVVGWRAFVARARGPGFPYGESGQIMILIDKYCLSTKFKQLWSWCMIYDTWCRRMSDWSRTTLSQCK